MTREQFEARIAELEAQIERSPGRGQERGDPDITLQSWPKHCDDCGADLSDLPGRERLQLGGWVVEIPPVQSVVLEAQR